jgi:lipid-binding SYLF domain-containing protein
MTMILRSILLIAALALATTAAAESKQERRVADATDVVDQLLRIPEQSIPPSLLSRAYGIAVIPNVVKAGFVLGVRHGKGILVVRQDDNTWSNPSFIKMTGGSVGWQAGAQSTDIILVFKTRQSVDGITKGKLTLGADASVAAGPVGRHSSLATDIRLQAEVYSYSRSRGLFAGIALEGAGITIDRKSNAAFYGSSTMTAADIFASGGNAAPAVANNFVQLLTAQTRRLPTQPSMTAGVGPQPGPQPKQKVRTFGISSPEEDDYEDAEVAREPR